jgi:hypothetical protein
VTGLTGLTGIQGNTGIQGVTGLGGAGINYRYFREAAVGTGGTLYLKTGQNLQCSEAGDRISKDSVLRTITIEVNVGDSLQTYDIEILRDPSGSPTVIATLSLPTSTKGIYTNSLSVNITAGWEIGARIVRTLGGSASAFNSINVTVILDQ